MTTFWNIVFFFIITLLLAILPTAIRHCLKDNDRAGTIFILTLIVSIALPMSYAISAWEIWPLLLVVPTIMMMVEVMRHRGDLVRSHMPNMILALFFITIIIASLGQVVDRQVRSAVKENPSGFSNIVESYKRHWWGQPDTYTANHNLGQ